MTYLFKLARRTARGRALALTALAALAACDTDQLTNTTADPTDTPAAEAIPAAAPLFATSFRGGIPFGVWALPTEEFGGVFNGANRNIDPNHLLRELAAIKAQGGRVSVSFAGPERFFKDENGHFSFSMWKARIDRYKGVDFTSYLEDGTIIGHYLIDEPNDPVNWTNRLVEGPMLEQMAAYSKQLWPKMTTIVRAKPSWVGQWTYRHLDAAWALWWTAQGDPAAYIRTEVAAAQRAGLGLIVGVNIRKGGPNKTTLDPRILESAGSILLAQGFACAFISWEYYEPYLARADVKAAMADLSRKAANHPARSCSRRSAEPPPPPTLPGIKGISLRAERVTESGKQLVHLRWAGAIGARMDIYRNGAFRRSTPNDRFARDYPQRPGTYTYKLCEAGKSRCSNQVTVTMPRR